MRFNMWDLGKIFDTDKATLLGCFLKPVDKELVKLYWSSKGTYYLVSSCCTKPEVITKQQAVIWLTTHKIKVPENLRNLEKEVVE
jgi:hypothetical protein